MNILPSQTKEFLSKKYWDKFFGKLKEQGDDMEFFEWYGNWKNFEPYLTKHVKVSDNIINIGCGKSLFSEDMYDDGFKNILNVDYSEQVIEDMIKRSGNIRPTLKYEVMDIFNMEYADQQFTAILDKGCLDAVYPENKEDIKLQVHKLFEEIQRIGTKRYSLISLLQEHIIDEIFEYFGQNKNYKITIYEVLIQNSKMYPFLVDIEFVQNDQPGNVSLILKNYENQQPKIMTFAECKEEIKKVQLQNNFMGSIKKLKAGQRFTLDLWDASYHSTPKYSLKIVDNSSKKILEQKTCGCFITPQGKENGYLFSTEKGNFDLLEQTGLSRLIIAILNPGFEFANLKQVQDELSSAMTDLEPKNCSNSPVPYMTDGDEIGEKGIIYQNEDFVIEEIMIEEEVFRRMIIKKNFNQVQSQFKLGYYANSNTQKAYLKESQKDLSSLMPEKKGMLIGIDDSYLDFEAHRAIIAGLSLFKPVDFNINEFKVVILGGGLCGLGKFMHNHFSNMLISNVEISSKIVEISKSHFEMKDEEGFSIVCQDALAYIDKKVKLDQKKKAKKNKKAEENSEKQGEEEQKKEEIQEQQEKDEKDDIQVGKPNGTDLIVIDINGEQHESSPPPQFLEVEFLKKIQSQLKTNTGVLAINVVAFGEKFIKPIIERIGEVFDIIYSIKTENELNEVVFAVNHKFKKSKNNQEDIILVDPYYTPDKKQIEQNFKSIMKQRSKFWDQTLNIEEVIRDLKMKIPKITGNRYERTQYHVIQDGENGEFNTSNLTKEQYQKDLSCITKQQQKKKQKNRQK